ncbi:MAG: UDP-2,3-diacylglucosamine diphosphatase [Synergistaceae bacterium]|nr:UDP-2,3-diacylglucosamine diphosphatase [Synergistaceae bacterium]
MNSFRYRTVFLSDLHLGTPWCKVKSLVRFLSSLECEKLYLVGDIIDGWKLARRPEWPSSHSSVIRSILSIAGRTPVTYIPGNHDEFMNEFDGRSFCGVKVCKEAVHTGADGRKYLVTHGHEFDAVMQHGRWLAWLGDRAYDITLRLNSGINVLRSAAGFEEWSLADFLKRKVKNAVKFFSRYETRIAQSVRKSGAEGIICGHIHNPAARAFQGICYFNCGDWIDHCSVLVEHKNGAMEIIKGFDKMIPAPAFPAFRGSQSGAAPAAD